MELVSDVLASEHGLYLHSNTCFVTMAARRDSCCRRPGPKLAEGLGTLLFPFIFSPPLRNSSVTFALLWLHPGDNPRTCCPACRELCSTREQGAAAGVSLKVSDYPERVTKVPHRWSCPVVLWLRQSVQHKEQKQKITVLTDPT